MSYLRAIDKPGVYSLRRYEGGGGVYIGRPSQWGNPFVLGKDGTREQVIARFEQYMRSRPDLMAAAKAELKGKALLCFCAPKPCHGDVLFKIANE